MLTSKVTDSGVDDHAVASLSLQHYSMYCMRSTKFLIPFLPFPSVTFSLFIVAEGALQKGPGVRRATERYVLRTLGRFSTVYQGGGRSSTMKVDFFAGTHRKSRGFTIRADNLMIYGHAQGSNASVRESGVNVGGDRLQ